MLKENNNTTFRQFNAYFDILEIEKTPATPKVKIIMACDGGKIINAMFWVRKDILTTDTLLSILFNIQDLYDRLIHRKTISTTNELVAYYKEISRNKKWLNYELSVIDKEKTTHIKDYIIYEPCFLKEFIKSLNINRIRRQQNNDLE